MDREPGEFYKNLEVSPPAIKLYKRQNFCPLCDTVLTLDFALSLDGEQVLELATCKQCGVLTRKLTHVLH